MRNFLIILICLIVISCEKESLTNEIDSTPIVSFTQNKSSISVIADGSSNDYQLHLCVLNSEILLKESSINVLVKIDNEKTTAIEGVHYNYKPKIITLDYSNNFIKNIDLQILTEVDPPLSKEIVFTIHKVDIENDIISNSISNLEIIYDCYVNLTGVYKVDSDVCESSHFGNIIITKNENGSWHMTDVSGGILWTCTTTDLFNDGNFEVNCDKVEFSNDNIIFNNYEGIEIGTIISGSWNQKTGVLKMQQFQNFYSFLPKYYNTTYIRQD